MRRTRQRSQGGIVHDEGFALMDAEADLRKRVHEQGALDANPRLQHHVAAITRGDTTTELRADRLRKLLVHHRLEATFGERFEQVYGEPLVTEAMRDPRAALRGKP